MSASSTQKPRSGDAGPPRKNLPAGKRGGPSSNSESPTSQDDTRKALTFHPLANIFPLLEGAEFDGLVADIKAHGQREPIALYEGQVLDGRNRLRACEMTGVAPRLETYAGDDPLALVISLNLKCRHLSESQRAMVAAKIATLKLGDNQHSEGPSIEEASRLLNVGHASVERAKTVQRAGAPELVEAVDALQADAIANGLVREIGQDAVQAIMAQAFGVERC